ncbi:MAG: M1 family metallopeptidase [Saprospiraceae bacterium]
MKCFLFTLFCFFTINIFSQNNYFQQKVDYKINVSLDDEKHQISGEIEMTYTNNSPDGLDSIYFHFWGNAFKNNTTAFAEQKLRTKSTKFYFSSDSDKGFYSDLNFMVDGQKAELKFDKKNPDIAVLILPKKINSGKTINIKSPFTLKIPASFSRLGHVGTSYQMTQWYPKPAVLDHKGWHPMPYLDMGEFYSEFGNFDVTITLPENYVVGASGILQTESEKAFLKNKVLETEAFVKKGIFPTGDEFPESSNNLKTIRYIAENVHDFAWFADKRFHVLKSEAKLASGKKVDTWAMFINEEADIWQRGAEYVTRAVEFYSEMVGEYPWPQATAVHSALSAGGGMEYPMITVIGNSGNARALDDVITHEVGHNWFYGILASNERDHAWMDEGMNSYYEYRYMRKYYGARADVNIPAFLMNHTHEDIYEIGYLYNARRNLDQAPDTHSNEFDMLNYGLGAYMKPGTVLGHLENYLGTAEFDRIMHLYYNTWKFKHPYPEDFRKLFEKESGKNLDWFFDGYIFSNKKLDYSINSIGTSVYGYTVSLKNRGEIAAPFPISGIKNGEVVETVWYEGFSNITEIDFPKGDYDQLIIDAENITLDVNRKNNNIKTSGVLKKIEPLQVGVLGAVENSRKNTINLWPALGYNEYDGFMVGLAVHNGIVPPKKWEYQLATMYGVNAKDLVGVANLQYNIFPKKEKIKKITLGVSSKAFNYQSLDSLRMETGFSSTHLQYQRIVPSIKIELQRSPTSHFYQIIQLRSILGEEEQTDFELKDSLGAVYVGNSYQEKIINELTWEIGNRRAINPFSLKLTLEQSSFEDIFDPAIDQSYIRANLEWKSAYYFDQKRRFDFRIFIGGFLKNDYRDRGFIANGGYNLTGQGFNDYRWDELYFGRTETSGFLSRQVTQREGGMKAALGSPYSEGRSNNFIFAVNLKSDLPQNLPLNLPIKPYFDLGYYKDSRPISANDPDFKKSKQLWYQFGFTLEMLDGAVGVHFPAVNSKHLKDLLNQSGQDNFFKRISFTLDLYKWNPWKIAENIQL